MGGGINDAFMSFDSRNNTKQDVRINTVTKQVHSLETSHVNLQSRYKNLLADNERLTDKVGDLETDVHEVGKDCKLLQNALLAAKRDLREAHIACGVLSVFAIVVAALAYLY